MKDRQRTVSAALVLCLNIGVDPPDVIKTQPCAKFEAWVDPTAYPDPKKAIEHIGRQLQGQYEVLSTKTRYKLSLDPNVEDAKRFCISLRRSAKDERILFHYNGHGVPRPTASGEIWVFNRGYTQYIPVSLYDLQSWLGAPCIFVYDCHAAGFIVSNYLRFVEKRKVDEQNGNKDPGAPPAKAFEDCIHLAACASDETLPMHPELPADLFTSCLTSPIEMAVRWFVLQSSLTKKYYTCLTIPGRISERRTPLGELNWIFTSITDTIAWTLFPRPLFKKLFRQDLVVAALFRNFLLAERIMRAHNCHPISYPTLPTTHDHPMWKAWDLAVDHCLTQLPALNAANQPGGKPYEYKHSKFFEEQLTAFEIWLKYKSLDLDQAPEQLPVVLQVLLSHIHRVRALVLLSRYLDLGPKAVHLALSIGIFPYVLKLLQSPTQELKPVLIFIWARIMAVDYTTIRPELLKDNGYTYFVNLLVPQQGFVIPSVNTSDHRAMCTFIISLFCRGYKLGQQKCTSPEILGACINHTYDQDNPLLRQWSCMCLSQIWDSNPDAKWLAVSENILEQLSRLLVDPVPEIRTACVIAFTNFLGKGDGELIPEELKAQELKLAQAVVTLSNDASFLVRREVMVFFSRFVKQYLSQMLVCAFTSLEDEAVLLNAYVPNTSSTYASPAESTVFNNVWRSLLVATEDPFPEVAQFAQIIVDYIVDLFDTTVLKDESETLEDQIVQTAPRNFRKKTAAVEQRLMEKANLMASPLAAHLQSPSAATSPAESRFATTIKRSVSFAASLRQAWMGSSPSTDGYQDGSASPALSSPSPASFNGPVHSMPYGFGKRPVNARYKGSSISSEESLGKKKQKITLPLDSGFFEWTSEYFQEPQMNQAEVDEPGSELNLERLWRKTRNEKIMAETQPEKDLALSGNWNNQAASLNNVTQPARLLFAQFEPHLVAVDTQDGVTVWDWAESKRLNRFCNGNPVNSRITDAKFLNEDDQPLLMTGSSEGVVRIYRRYESHENVELACAWRALTDLLPAQKNTGLVAEWQQSRGALLVGGDVRVIRVWDAPREMCTSDIPARSSSPVTSLTSDQVAGNVVVAGFGDGAIRVYDRRLDYRDTMVRCWKTHSSWVANVRMQRGGARELISASTDGKICLWDIRLTKPIIEYYTSNSNNGGANTRDGISVMDVHEHAPIIAAGTRNIQLWSTLGVPVASRAIPKPGSGSYINRAYNTYSSASAFTNAFGYDSSNGYSSTNGGVGNGYTNGYNAAVSNGSSYELGGKLTHLTFHPHRMMMAVNFQRDSTVTVFKCGNQKA